MAFEQLKRNQYKDPASSSIPSHTSEHHEDDWLKFHLPLARMHHAALHDWGIAQGFEVSGAAGASEVVVQPGIAVTGNGQLIALADPGNSQIGANPSTTTPLQTPGGSPAHVTLANAAGKTLYVTVQFSQYFISNAGPAGTYEQRPWIRLQEATGVNAYQHDGSTIVLAVVGVSGAGALAFLDVKDTRMSGPGVTLLPHSRRLVGQNLSTLRIRSSKKTNNSTQDVVAGSVTAADPSGLALLVPGSGDSITLAHEVSPNPLNCASVIVRANALFVKNAAGGDALSMDSGARELTIGRDGQSSAAAGRLTVTDGYSGRALDLNGQNATISAGIANMPGHVRVTDKAGTETFHLDGETATETVGAKGTPGQISVREDVAGDETVHVDGNNGKVTLKRLASKPNDKGNEIDVDTRDFQIHARNLRLDGVSGGNLRALTDVNKRLVINEGGDYTQGVDVNGLHLVDHVKLGFWQEISSWSATPFAMTPFFEVDTMLKATDWDVTSACHIGLIQDVTVLLLAWLTRNDSYTSAAGTRVVKWSAQIVSLPLFLAQNSRAAERSVTWIARRT